MTRGLLDSDLIAQQTDDYLDSGAGIFQNFGLTEARLQERAEKDETLNYALTDDIQEIEARKTRPMGGDSTSGAKIDRKHIMEW